MDKNTHSLIVSTGFTAIRGEPVANKKFEVLNQLFEFWAASEFHNQSGNNTLCSSLSLAGQMEQVVPR